MNGMPAVPQGTFLRAKQNVTAAIELTNWLHHHQITFPSCPPSGDSASCGMRRVADVAGAAPDFCGGRSVGGGSGSPDEHDAPVDKECVGAELADVLGRGGGGALVGVSRVGQERPPGVGPPPGSTADPQAPVEQTSGVTEDRAAPADVAGDGG